MPLSLCLGVITPVHQNLGKFIISELGLQKVHAVAIRVLKIVRIHCQLLNHKHCSVFARVNFSKI